MTTIVETTAVTGAAQTVAAEALGWQPGVNVAGRYGTEIAVGSRETALTVARALRARGYRARVVR